MRDFLRSGVQGNLLLDEYDRTIHALLLSGVLCRECRYWLHWLDDVPPAHKAWKPSKKTLAKGFLWV